MDAPAASAACHADLVAGGVHLPLQHRSSWLAMQPQSSWFIRVQDGNRCRCGFAIEALRSHALPGHRVLRTKRFGAMAEPAARRRGLEAAVELARSEPRVLRYHIETYTPHEAVRQAIAADLEALGFRRAAHPRSYEETIAIDLHPSEDELFASLHRTARRHIRAATKKPVDVAPVNDPVYGPRVRALLRETFRRTGGRYAGQDWPALIAFTRDNPDLARMIGMFLSGDRSPAGLWAFAVGYNHGDHVEYAMAASTRETGNLRVPLGYALAWDLVLWAKSVGADWFDFGGITRGTRADPDNPLGGISDFKRYFGTEVVKVGEEWVFAPRPVRAALADRVASIAGRVVHGRGA